MSEQLTEFIERVEAFEIDPGAKTLRFEDRLARENGWTRQFACRVVHEYKRFCILAMRSGHHVTPSEQVDQAWHLHLTYTRSYWQRFCDQTLGNALHHEPTEGGYSEGQKFRDWYSETLASYRRIFGQEPPADIWPSPAERFAHAGDWKWINVGHCWVLPKRRSWIALAVVVAIVTIFAVPGCRLPAGVNVINNAMPNPLAGAIFPFNLGATHFLWFYASLCMLTFIYLFALRLGIGKLNEDEPMARVDDRELTADELAVLSGGGPRLAHVSLARLFSEDRIAAAKTLWWWNRFIVKGACPEASGIDRDVYEAIRSDDSIHAIMAAVEPHYNRIDSDLVSRGYRKSDTISGFAPLLVIGMIVLLGLLRLGQGLLEGEEIGFLVVMIVGFTVISILALIAICRRDTRPTERGQQILQRLKTTLDNADPETQSLGVDMLAINVAVLGTSAIAYDAQYEPLNALLRHVGPNNSSSSTGCGSGCGGGGGGCGGGGCGGCGG